LEGYTDSTFNEWTARKTAPLSMKATILMDLGRYIEALNIFLQIQKDMERMGFVRYLHINTQSIGSVYDALNEPDKAIEYYRKALDYAMKQNDTLWVAKMYNLIALEYDTKEMLDSSIVNVKNHSR
jgi:tetratricopeptide (TPR) repeat protein